MAQDVPLKLRFDAFDLDEAEATLRRDRELLPLPPKAFGVLCALARQSGRLVGKDALLDAVWGHRHVSESVLKTTISELRAALADDPKQPRYIETVSRRGYRFIGMAATAAMATHAAVEQARLIGRDAALARLDRAWDDARAGRRRIVWIVGEPGVGKTTLLECFEAAHPEALIARGQSVEHFGSGEPYLPVLEALSRLCRSDEDLVTLMRTVAPTWLLQLPWIGSDSERAALRAEVAGSSQDRMLRELGELLDRYTERRPLAIVIEDLHWSDDATVRLMDHVARRRERAALLWLATFRPAEIVGTEHPLVAVRSELRLHRLCEEIALDAFSEVELAHYVAQAVPGSKPSEAFVRALHRHTDGLPLFVASVLDEMAVEGPVDVSREPASALQVPDNLAAVVERRISRLPAEVQSLLENASVLGVEFDADTLAQAIERDTASIAATCDDQSRRGAWIAGPQVAAEAGGALHARYAFRHAIYRHVFYERMGTLARAQAHRRAAQVLEARRSEGWPVAAAELALHAERGHDLEAALRHYATAATEAALHQFAPREAFQLTTHALELLAQLPETASRDALELALVTPRAIAAAHLFGAASHETVQAFRRAHALGESVPSLRSRAFELSALGWSFNARGEFDQARQFGEQVFAIARSKGDLLLEAAGCGVVGTSDLHRGALADARRWLEQGLAAFAQAGPAADESPGFLDLAATMHARLAHALSHLGLPDSAHREIEAANARAQRTGDPFTRMVVLVLHGSLEVRLAHVDGVAPIAAALERLLVEHAFGPGFGMSDWMNGWLLVHTGDPHAGHERIVRSARTLQRHGMLWACSGIVGHAAYAQVVCGRLPEARAHLDEAFALAKQTGERMFLPDLWLVESRLGMASKDTAAARASVEACRAEAHSQGALWMELEAAVALCGLPGASEGDRRVLREALDRLPEGGDSDLAARARAQLAVG